MILVHYVDSFLVIYYGIGVSGMVEMSKGYGCVVQGQQHDINGLVFPAVYLITLVVLAL